MAADAAQLDTTIEVVTPENIAFHYRVAGPFRRWPAYLLDLGIRAAVFMAVAFGAGFLGGVTGARGMVGAIVLLSWFLLEWFYGGFFETYMSGQTPGKWMMGIRVVTVDGQPIDGLQAVLRNVLRVTDMYPMLSLEVFGAPYPIYMIPTFMVGLVAMALNRRFQRLGDLVCGTIVVIEDRPWLTGVAQLEDPRAAQLAEYLPADFRASRSLARTLAAYVDRRRFFSPAGRREVAHFLGEPLVALFGLPSDTSHDLLLCALYYRTFIADRAEENPFADDGESPFAPRGMPTTVAASPFAANPGTAAPADIHADRQEGTT